MKTNDSGKNAKKSYTKPTVDSRALKLGVYGDYGRGDNSPSNPGHDDHGGNHRDRGHNRHR